MAASARPYPLKWERHIVLGDGWRIFVRPLKPDDEGLIRDLLVHVSNEDLGVVVSLFLSGLPFHGLSVCL